MDKYDILVEAFVAKAKPSNQAEARAVMVVIADLARGVEQMGADIDRIATALETIAKKLT